QVLLGDLPLSSPDAPFDLSLVPVWALERVEVYRGDAPVWFGNGSIGGVVRLVPRQVREPEAFVGLSGGSFGTYQVRGGVAAATERFELSSAVGLAGTQGNFPFDYDGGTPLDPRDDRRVR